jgi:hypothetical protein
METDMADYFTHFSSVLDVGTPDNAKSALDLYRTFMDEAAREDEPRDGFRLSIHPDGRGSLLWIRDDVSGDPLQVAAFVRHCAESFGLSGRWGFQYANTCSRPRVNAFGGGAHVLDFPSLKTVRRAHTSHWLNRVLARGSGKWWAP